MPSVGWVACPPRLRGWSAGTARLKRYATYGDGGTWTAWTQIDGALTGVTAIGEIDRRIDLFGVDRWGNLFHRTWSPWWLQDPPYSSLS